VIFRFVPQLLSFTGFPRFFLPYGFGGGNPAVVVAKVVVAVITADVADVVVLSTSAGVVLVEVAKDVIAVVSGAALVVAVLVVSEGVVAVVVAKDARLQ